MITWQYFPKSDATPEHLNAVVELFRANDDKIDSSRLTLKSNEVLIILRTDLLGLNFKVEQGYRIEDKIKVPVLFGMNGEMEKSFHVDAFQQTTGTVLEVEAGRAVQNFGFL